MATKAAKKISVEETLRTLYDLQLIDSTIDRIRDVRGELPLEVEDLEDEIEGLKIRLEKIKGEIDNLQIEIKNKKNAIKDSEALISKYKEQQNNVRNNREFEALDKEIEYQNLEIQLSQKRIREFEVSIAQKTEILNDQQEKFDIRNADLKHKKEELANIMAETEKEENALLEESIKIEEKLEERLLKAYKKIRGSQVNGLAVVPIERGASGGSFFKIPPQIQIDVQSRKKVMISEFDGRILVDPELAAEEEEKIKLLCEKILKS